MSKQQPRFNIDFFEFSFLVESCIPPRPIARSMFWDDVIWKYYNVLTPNERNRLFNWIQQNPSFRKEQEDCLLFFDRFNPDNQYSVETFYEGESNTYSCFKHDDRFWIKRDTFIEPKFIVNTKKIEQQKDGE